MKNRIIKSALTAIIAMSIASCVSGGASTNLSKDFISNAPEPVEQLNALIEKAGTTIDDVEFFELSMMVTARDTNDVTNNITISIINPKDKDKAIEYSWNDNKDRRNAYDVRELVMTDRFGSDIIEGYDNFKGHLFVYSDVKPYLDNLATYCTEALEASGYGDKAYVQFFTFSLSAGASIQVAMAGTSGISKSFDISADKQHIEI